MANPFQNWELRDWFFLDSKLPQGLPEEVITAGSDPFEETEFDGFLTELGFEIFAMPASELDILIVGTQNWNEQSLHRQIESRRGEQLRVYSQEMFLSLLATGKDPLEDAVVAEAFGEGHPALEFIQEWGFDWPKTRIVPVSHSPTLDDPSGWQAQSVLGLMGYRAGANGRNRQTRRGCLHRAFTEELSFISDAVYRAGWGVPNSGTRLFKIAERISMNIILHSAKGNHEAVGHWTEDLAWLKTEYYDGRHAFPWPSTTP